jgi:hypothetical protein
MYVHNIGEVDYVTEVIRGIIDPHRIGRHGRRGEAREIIRGIIPTDWKGAFDGAEGEEGEERERAGEDGGTYGRMMVICSN